MSKKVYNASKNNKTYFSRQTAPKTFDLNASIYFWKRDSLLKDKIQSKDLFIMPAERSIDIDDQLDFEIVSYLIKNNNYKKLFLNVIFFYNLFIVAYALIPSVFSPGLGKIFTVGISKTHA